MAVWDLPETAEIGGETYAIRTDYRDILELLCVLESPEIHDWERGTAALAVLFPDFESMPRALLGEAVSFMKWFVAGGDAKAKAPKAKLADWEQDFQLIVAPVNRVLGFDVRGAEFVHWWTFLAAYREIGDCLFAQVVSIRNKKRKGKKLEKWEAAFYADNRDLVDFARQETEEDAEVFDVWLKG